MRARQFNTLPCMRYLFIEQCIHTKRVIKNVYVQYAIKTRKLIALYAIIETIWSTSSMKLMRIYRFTQ